MKRAAFLKRKKAWARFQAWEARERRPFPKQAFSTIGEWVDFFLSKHRRLLVLPDVRGIQEMQKRLSHLSLNQ